MACPKPKFRTLGIIAGLCAVGAVSGPAWASDADALDLKPDIDESAKPSGGKGLRTLVELAAGRMTQRYGLPTEDTRRASLDLNWEVRLAPQWRAVLSDRVDDQHPVDAGSRSTLNSLREASLGWQSEDGRLALDGGRINYRNGPGYGFNPTDFFRDGSVRALTSSDPLALRENRLGTVMIRAQKVWQGGSVTLAVAPKLRDSASLESFSPDWGATNHASRALLVVSAQPFDKVSLQAFAFDERGKGAQIGVNANALLGDATVAHAEWAGGKDHDLLSAALGAPKTKSSHRAVVGLTFTTPGKLSLTGEFQYNGFALSKAGWSDALRTHGLEPLAAYQIEVQRRQDIASRKAAMVYVSQRDAGLKGLELTGLLRVNLEDHSRFWWAEARYHFNRIDLALQWQQNQGRADSEFGAMPARSLLQLIVAAYF